MAMQPLQLLYSSSPENDTSGRARHYFAEKVPNPVEERRFLFQSRQKKSIIGEQSRNVIILLK